jgi:hypothetical protein
MDSGTRKGDPAYAATAYALLKPRATRRNETRGLMAQIDAPGIHEQEIAVRRCVGGPACSPLATMSPSVRVHDAQRRSKRKWHNR